MVAIKIENIVASTSIGVDLELSELVMSLKAAEYNPKRFPGLVYRMDTPRTATLIFRSGKLVCTGAKNLDDVKEAIKTVTNDIKAAGLNVKKGADIVVQNIVATVDLGAELNLNTIAIALGLENIEYEPEQFPGLVYRVDDPPVVILLFGSGKLVCTGAKNEEDVARAVDKITEELRAGGLLT